MMREIFVALLVGAVAVGLAAPAFAADLKFTGAYRVRGQFDKAIPCLGRTPSTSTTSTGVLVTPLAECDGNEFDQRFRPKFEVETEGGVRGVIYLEIGDVIFGDRTGTSAATSSTFGRGSGGAVGADAVNVETKNAYIDFPVPATPLRLRAGIQPYFTSKNLILEEDASGLSLYGKLGDVNANLWWFRASVDRDTVPPSTSPQTSSGVNARDVYGIDLAFSPMKDLGLNVYFVYDVDMLNTAGTPVENTTGYWIGAGGRGTAQNIRWDLDFVYGTKEITGTTPIGDQKGWMVDGGVGMALPGSPLDLDVRGWYATGNKMEAGTTDSDAFPVVSSPDHDPGTQIWSSQGIMDFENLADNAQNTWGLGLLARWTVSPALRVTGSAFYIGTVEEGETANSTVGDGFIFGVDSVGTEVALKVDYTIAKGLVATFVAAHLSLGDDTAKFTGVTFDDATKVAAQVAYAF